MIDILPVKNIRRVTSGYFNLNKYFSLQTNVGTGNIKSTAQSCIAWLL